MHRSVRFLALAPLALAIASGSARAESRPLFTDEPVRRPVWNVSWTEPAEAEGTAVGLLAPLRHIDWIAAGSRLELLPPSPLTRAAAEAAAQQRPMAVEYSDAYNLRRKVHLYASFATVPLFIAQYAVGQKLYDGTASESTRSVHGALAAGTAVLFGVNTVTGVWNLWEGRKDPNHRAKRLVHGILMLAADAGFAATGALAPDSEHGFASGNRSTHRSVALASMGVATVSYLIMLVGR